jgi:hypothetical protein
MTKSPGFFFTRATPEATPSRYLVAVERSGKVVGSVLVSTRSDGESPTVVPKPGQWTEWAGAADKLSARMPAGSRVILTGTTSDSSAYGVAPGGGLGLVFGSTGGGLADDGAFWNLVRFVIGGSAPQVGVVYLGPDAERALKGNSPGLYVPGL